MTADVQNFGAICIEYVADLERMPVEGVPTLTKVIGLFLVGATFDHVAASSALADTLRILALAYMRKQQSVADAISTVYKVVRKCSDAPTLE